MANSTSGTKTRIPPRYALDTRRVKNDRTQRGLRRSGFGCQPRAVLFGVVVAIGTGLDAGDPITVGLVPRDGVPQAGIERNLRRPAQFALGFRVVDGIPQIVTWAIRDEPDQRSRLSDRIQQAVRQFDVRQLTTAAEIVDLARLAFSPCGFNPAAMVDDMNPVAHIQPRPIQRQR